MSIIVDRAQDSCDEFATLLKALLDVVEFAKNYNADELAKTAEKKLEILLALIE